MTDREIPFDYLEGPHGAEGLETANREAEAARTLSVRSDELLNEVLASEERFGLSVSRVAELGFNEEMLLAARSIGEVSGIARSLRVKIIMLKAAIMAGIPPTAVLRMLDFYEQYVTEQEVASPSSDPLNR